MHPLHLQALEAAKRFKQAEADLVELFQKIEEERVFSKLGYASLFEYGVKALGLSEANTYTFIQVARKSRDVPALKEAIIDGRITLSKAKKIAPIITSENQQNWIAFATISSKRELEKQVAKANPRLAVRETSQYVSEDRLEVKLGVSEELMKKWNRVQDLISQKNREAASLEEALGEMVEMYLEKNDPIRKAKRAKPQLVPAWVYRSSATPGKLKRAN